ncbi:hypothetical protein ACFL2V_07395 [Pseudomonadota bacterium]
MGILSLVVIIPALILYYLLGIAVLNATRIPVNFLTLFAFVVSGALSGVVSFITSGAVISDAMGHIGDGELILLMFLVSAVVAVSVSLGAAKLIAKYAKQRQCY